MSGFSLLSLAPLHLEKVINKIQETSYFRLQQSCSDLEEFIRSSRYISVNIDGHWELAINRITSTFELNRNLGTAIKPEAMYGARLRLLRLHCPIQDAEFEALCNILEKYRITCIIFHVLGINWTAEQCTRIFRILKPEKVDFNSQGSNRFGALFHCKTMKAVDISLNFEDVQLVENLLSQFRYVAVHGQINSTPSAFLRWLFLLLITKPFPNLHGFSFDLYGTSEALTNLEIIEKLSNGFGGQLPNLGLTATFECDLENGETLYLEVDMPKFKCTVTIINGHLILIESSKKEKIARFC